MMRQRLPPSNGTATGLAAEPAVLLVLGDFAEAGDVHGVLPRVMAGSVHGGVVRVQGCQ
jgi:hypothetical protein